MAIKKRHLESSLQQSCVKWFDLQYPHFKMNLFAIPNEGARTPANGARMKAQGRRAGVADMFLAMGNPNTHITLSGGNGIDGLRAIQYMGLFIEFKYGKGTQNDNQKAFQKAVESQGYRYEIITDFDSFKKLIEEYLK